MDALLIAGAFILAIVLGAMAGTTIAAAFGVALFIWDEWKEKRTLMNELRNPNPSIRRRRKAKPDRITADNLPDPECILGYPLSRVEDLLGPSFERFRYWMRGQTVAQCDGRSYNYEIKGYEPTGCGPHGTVVYVHDLKRWLANEGVMH